MKKLLLALIILVSTNLYSQTLTENGKVAHPSPNKDTLYILVDMFATISYIWSMSEYLKERPILVPVKSLSPYIVRREEEK